MYLQDTQVLDKSAQAAQIRLADSTAPLIEYQPLEYEQYQHGNYSICVVPVILCICRIERMKQV